MEKGGLIYFKVRPSDIEWKNIMEREGKVGHPPYAEWFCEKHYNKTKNLSHLTKSEALNEY